MKYKISNMAKYARKYGHHINSEKDARDMEICVEYLKRLIDDDMDQWKHHPSYCKELGRIIGRKMICWWD